MVAPFKIFQLPEVVLKKTLNVMELMDVFEISMCSKSAREIIKRVKVKISKLYIAQHERTKTVAVHKHELKPYDLFFSFNPPFKLPVSHFTLGCGHKIQYSHKENQGYFCRKNHFETHARHLLEYLADLFHCHTIRISLQMSLISDLRSIVTLPIFRRCSELNLFGILESPDDLEFLFKALKKVDSLLFFGNFPDLTIYRNEIFQVDHFEALYCPIRHFLWITSEDLMSMNCETMLLSGQHTLTDENLNGFIKKWIESTDESLRTRQLEVTVPRDGIDYDEDEFLKDISFKTWDPKRRPQFFECRNTLRRIDEVMDLKNGKDIARNSDGRIATVDFIDNKFCFFVWPVTH